MVVRSLYIFFLLQFMCDNRSLCETNSMNERANKKKLFPIKKMSIEMFTNKNWVKFYDVDKRTVCKQC